jgi:DNA/RNA endonuclease YhcR with UshA esterase domain
MKLFCLTVILLASSICPARNNSEAACVPFVEASKHMGSNQCVKGTVEHVENGGKGVTFLNFCKDNASARSAINDNESKTCPFSVVVFPADLKKMGDVHQLEGRQIEIKGTIQDYDGRAEIVLRRSQQLGTAAFLLFPRVPTDYDVERGGHKASGSTHAKAPKKTTTTQSDPIAIEEPGEPQ